MNPFQALELVEAAIKNRKPSTVGRYYLTFEHHKFICHPFEQVPRPTHIIRIITNHQATNGFTGAEWNKISDQISSIKGVKNL